MKAIKVGNKISLSVSKAEMELLYKQAGLFDNVIKKVKEALEPEKTNPYIGRSEQMRDDNGTYHLTNVLQESEVLAVKDPQKVNMDEIKKMVKANSDANMDPFFLITLPKAVAYIEERNGANINAGPLKILLYRIFHLAPKSRYWNMAAAAIQKWHKEKVENEQKYERKKNPYL